MADFLQDGTCVGAVANAAQGILESRSQAASFDRLQEKQSPTPTVDGKLSDKEAAGLLELKPHLAHDLLHIKGSCWLVMTGGVVCRGALCGLSRCCHPFVGHLMNIPAFLGTDLVSACHDSHVMILMVYASAYCSHYESSSGAVV